MLIEKMRRKEKMKRKAFQLLSLCAVLMFLLSACGNSTADKNAASSGSPTADSPNSAAEGIGENTSFSGKPQDAQTDPATQKSAEEYDILGGQLWEVSGVLVRNKVVDIHDNKDLESFYRATYLSFGSDGHFTYLDAIPKGGTYEPYETDDEYDCFLLKTDTIYQYDSDKNELVEIESGTKKPYIIYVLDDNTFEFVEFDPMTGKAKANEIPLFFAKSHEESPYIQNHKTEIAQNSGNSANSIGSRNGNSANSTGSSGSGANSAGSSGNGANSAGSSGNGANSAGSSTDRDTNLNNNDRSSTVGDSSSYQSILDTYTEKMEKAVPGLVSQYRSEASGVTDIGKLAEICNNKIGKLAGICNEGVGKMAELMNSRGDSYSTYESWAGKLMDNYSDIAQEIQDAYLDSAMY